MRVQVISSYNGMQIIQVFGKFSLSAYSIMHLLSCRAVLTTIKAPALPFLVALIARSGDERSRDPRCYSKTNGSYCKRAHCRDVQGLGHIHEAEQSSAVWY